ncbi:hypothetical protein O6H91_08G112000 [Diphasiastrum complanatum]|uniref:Uncharacterized protein n=1 Tax=Diphasiastrum complanatum TaxID=34168 RepID=A0ACC2D132_DIPCM|nr:hypothetical protein O6H91_08G112000 [Diphasiastrum complanatum]
MAAFTSFFQALRRSRPSTAAMVLERVAWQGSRRHFSLWDSKFRSELQGSGAVGGTSEMQDLEQNLLGPLTKPSDDNSEKDGREVSMDLESEYAALGDVREGIGGREPDAVVGFIEPAMRGSDLVGNAAADTWSNVHSPVDAVIAMLDAVHTTTGVPWWLTIAGSTMALRASLFPLTIIQLKKVSKFSNLWPKLPPPISKYGSGKTYLEQWNVFRQRCQEVEAPNPLWLIVVPLVHIPIFISWILAVRQMAIVHYPGFDMGGAFWFVDLTVPAQGTVGAIFPLLVAITYFTNIQISFTSSALKSGHMVALIKWYKWWLQFLTIPALYVGFSLPQGIFMYWLPNNLCSLAQTLVLQNPAVRKRLGITSEPIKLPVFAKSYVKDNKPLKELKYDELVVLAAEHVAKRQHGRAIELLNYALQKSPENVEAYIALGKLHLDQQEFGEAADYYNLAATKAKDDRNLIVAKSGAGVALFSQGKKTEAIAQLRIVESLPEPNDDSSKHRYFRALVILGSALYQEDQKFEALDVLRKAAKYDPSVHKFYVSKLEKELGLDNPP